VRIFHCDHCRHLLFFENTQCVKCGHPLAYLPDLGVVGSLEPAGEEPGAEGRWRTPIPRGAGRAYKLCENYSAHNVCNWALPADDPHSLCISCRLTRVIPDLSRPGHKPAWYKIEVAKRRLVYTLAELKLPLLNKADDPERGLAFEFLADPDDPAAPRVLTGHADGVITINVAEADDPEREKRRVQMHEPYRTLLGHFRHEVGHYYWERLIRDDRSRLEPFRSVFGDERASYADAVKRHYEAGAPADWQEHFISAYATTHPWEDWAETWAHYLHMIDALETAAACGVRLRPPRQGEPALRQVSDPVEGGQVSFDELMEGWFPLTYMLNNLNRGLGQADAYPFVISGPVVEKLRFVHDSVAGQSNGLAAGRNARRSA
jgi:hypothetical protein